jgi:hypothetical protein
VIEWGVAFLLTVLVEVPIAVVLAPPGRRRRIAGDAVLVNLCTHPFAWLAIRTLGWSWTLVEIGVAATELLFYRHVPRLRWSRAALIAVVANGITAALSFVI